MIATIKKMMMLLVLSTMGLGIQAQQCDTCYLNISTNRYCQYLQHSGTGNAVTSYFVTGIVELENKTDSAIKIMDIFALGGTTLIEPCILSPTKVYLIPPKGAIPFVFRINLVNIYKGEFHSPADFQMYVQNSGSVNLERVMYLNLFTCGQSVQLNLKWSIEITPNTLISQ